MYVTRPLSMYKNSPSALSLPPPEGPNSGILIVQDEEAEPTCCFGICKSHRLSHLPFPQNKRLELIHTTSEGENVHVHYNPVVFIPVLNHPLSSNLYYVIQPKGKHKGKAFTCSKEEDIKNCCFCRCVCDKKPQPFSSQDIYQQFAIHPQKCCGPCGFTAKSVEPDGFPPECLRRNGWKVYTSAPHNLELGEAVGINTNLRASLPDFNFPLSCKSSTPLVTGKWYCPFMFIKEGTLKDQVSKSVYYEMTLEQRWEQIFSCENVNGKENRRIVVVDMDVQKEAVFVAGREVQERNLADEVMWFKGFSEEREEINVGVGLEIVERMKWEEERVGWIGGNEIQVRVKREEDLGGNVDVWRRFCCYVLIESFVLKRMDGSLVISYDFKHTHQIRSKWE